MSMSHDITSAVPAYKRRTRKGRGKAAGKGKTGGQGTKGGGARAGGPYWKTGHEGGQTPIHRRLPTRGFSNDPFERNWYIVNVKDLQAFDEGATVDAAALIRQGLIRDTKLPVKVLGDGEVGKKLTVVASWYSKSAVAKIQAAGGTAQNAKGEAFTFPKPKRNTGPKPESAEKTEEKPAKKGKPEKAKKAPKPENPEAPQAEQPAQ